MLRIAQRLCVVTVGLLAVASCSMPPERPLADPVAPSTLRIDDQTPTLAEGQDYRVVGSVAGVLNGRAADFAGVTEDGTEVYVRSSESADGDHDKADPHALALVARDSRTGETRVLSDRPRTQGPVDAERIPGNALQLGSVAVSGRHAVWIESVSVAVTGDLYAYDVKSDSERLLLAGQEPDQSDAPWPSAHADPVIVDDQAYFVGFTTLTRGDLPGESSVFAVPLDGSAPPAEIVAGASAVFADVEGRLQVVIADRLVGWDPARGPQGEVEGQSLAAAGGADANQGVRVTAPVAGGSVQIDSPEHGRLTVELDGGRAGYFSATRRWVAFRVDGQGAFLVDLQRRRLARMPQVTVPPDAPTSGEDFVLIQRTRGQDRSATYPMVRLAP